MKTKEPVQKGQVYDSQNDEYGRTRHLKVIEIVDDGSAAACASVNETLGTTRVIKVSVKHLQSSAYKLREAEVAK